MLVTMFWFLVKTRFFLVADQHSVLPSEGGIFVIDISPKHGGSGAWR